jgi:hypothetical protein
MQTRKKRAKPAKGSEIVCKIFGRQMSGQSLPGNIWFG